MQLRPDYSENLPYVWADPIRVRQVILNLLSNAIKFTSTGSVTLKAEVVDDWVAISVIDTGIGIPDEAQSTIFDRFHQISTRSFTDIIGTGLGLDISKQISQMHGGDLEVFSEFGKGSRFTFTLPIATPEQLERGKAPIQVNDAFTVFEQSSAHSDEVHSILLVEDEVSMRELLRRALESAGYIVIDTHDGAQVMELALGLVPHVIVLDMHLPMSVDGMIAQLKSESATADIPIIVHTARCRARAMALGIADFVAKPATPEVMIGTVQKVLAQRDRASSDK
ncbi:MAG: ATP-binding protein [Anaerolineae bacterium]